MKIFILISLAGYIGLWILGSILFLVYFKIYNIPLDLKNTVTMIEKVPVALAIATVPLCSFISFFVATKIVLKETDVTFNNSKLLQIGAASLICTIILDVLITVVGEKIDITAFPVNLMYLLAWLVIVPAVLLAGNGLHI